jgi:hypothetical protein
MTRRSQRRDQDGPVVPPAVGPLGVPADPAGQAPGAGLKGAIRRWRAQRQLRRTELRETKVIARENLRDFKRSTGGEGDAPGGMF